MKRYGRDPSSGAAVEISFDSTVLSTVPYAGATDLYLAPGWIDIQVNGFGGVDFNDPQISPDDVAHAIDLLIATGVTRFYPTVITGSPERMIGALANLARASASIALGGAIDGFHVEGPHLSATDGPRGAHPRQWIRKPDFDEFRRWQDATGNRVRIVTLAPEWPEAARYVEKIVAEGVVAAIGHTQATAAQIGEAVAAGASLSTHLGNAAEAAPARWNYIWEQLAEDRLAADFIVDDFHLPEAFLRVALRAKGIGRSVLITDAAAPAGCPPGPYTLGEVPVELTLDQRVVLAGQGRLAGSALRMDRGIGNLVRRAGVTLGDAVRMATVNAATAGRVPGRQNSLAPGDRADFVLFRFDAQRAAVTVESTWLDGREVYCREKAS